MKIMCSRLALAKCRGDKFNSQGCEIERGYVLLRYTVQASIQLIELLADVSLGAYQSIVGLIWEEMPGLTTQKEPPCEWAQATAVKALNEIKS